MYKKKSTLATSSAETNPDSKTHTHLKPTTRGEITKKSPLRLKKHGRNLVDF